MLHQTIRVALFLTLLFTMSCTKEEQTELKAAISPTAACIASAIWQTENIPLLEATCGAAASDIFHVVSQLLEHEPSQTSHPDQRLALRPNMRARLMRIQVAAAAEMAEHNTTSTLSKEK